MKLRLRGIYATALTHLALDAGHDVVQASPAIASRFDTPMPSLPADVAVEQAPDRQGVVLTGSDSAVTEAAEMFASVAIDTLVIPDPTPTAAIFDGIVDRTKGSGAVLTLPGGAEGFLPFDAAEGYVDVGDHLRVQVQTPEPPWTDRAPRLCTTIEAPRPLVTLRRDTDGPTAATDGEQAMELVRSTELLSTTAPDGWGIHWERDAVDASFEALDEALAEATSIAEAIEDQWSDPTAMESLDHPQTVVTPLATRWLWFGRESRFALDTQRRAVVPTMTGHHRIKATGNTAATAVDFVETLCDTSPDAFPFVAVADQFGPTEGDTISIKHGKPRGHQYSLGTGTVTDRDDEGTVTVRREMTSHGTYDALGTDREPGDVAITKFVEGRWWYPTVYRSPDGTRKGTYVNICTPVEIYPEAVRYIDLHIDVIRRPDGSVESVDEDELQAATDDGPISVALAERAREVARSVQQALV